MNVRPSGAQGSAGFAPSVSANGRYVAFQCFAGLVPDDTNGTWDVYVRDLSSGITERVSVSSSGAQSDAFSVEPRISAGGRFVAFYSSASNLVPADTNGTQDVFVHDRLSGTTERVSVDSAGVEADNGSSHCAISADGRCVAFVSWASNFAPPDTNIYADVFVHDRWTGTTELVSLSSGGAQGDLYSDGSVAISFDGRFVAFDSKADNLVPLDTNNAYDVFVRDRLTGVTERVSVDSAGIEGNQRSEYASISADGRRVAFWSEATNLVPLDTDGFGDIFVHDRSTGTTERVSVGGGGVQANSASYSAAISAGGDRVAFASGASNLVPGDSNTVIDVFVRELSSGTTERVSVASHGAQANGFSNNPSLSATGRTVAFESLASNLVPLDTNLDIDVFARTDVALVVR